MSIDYIFTNNIEGDFTDSDADTDVDADMDEYRDLYGVPRIERYALRGGDFDPLTGKGLGGFLPIFICDEKPKMETREYSIGSLSIMNIINNKKKNKK